LPRVGRRSTLGTTPVHDVDEEGCVMAREYDPNPDDERQVDLSDDPELVVPPTIDPDERVEEDPDDDPEALGGDGPQGI
jgi:hypothetical protein